MIAERHRQEIAESGLGCNTVSGKFEIKSLR